jgi:polyphosphate glucokinase
MKVKLSLAKRQRATMQQPRADAALAALIDAMVASPPSNRKVLVIDVGGTSVKLLASGQTEVRSFQSGPKLTPERMVLEVKKLAVN